MKSLSLITLIGVSYLITGCARTKEDPLPDKITRFAPTEITADISNLSEGNRIAIPKLIAAARLMDTIYLQQVWTGNLQLLRELQADRTEEGLRRFHYFTINMSPWSSLDHNEPFIDGVPTPKPPGANHYPEDMSKDEFNTWLATLSDLEKEKATGYFHVVRRDAHAALKLVPYSEEYNDMLQPAARLLREAAAITDNVTLRTYLTKRADAFLTNDYYESDIAWMELDSPIDVTIGPYEVYMDELFNYKAAFEAFITIRNDEETVKLTRFSSYLQELESNLPIEEKYLNPRIGALAPIRVVDVIYTAGETKAGVQTAAFNLPNDERVTREKGSKRVMLKNIQEAKFRKVLTPIAGVALHPTQRTQIAFEPFFTHILAHELMHGLGPNTIIVNGKETTVRKELKELGSAMEEAKADISGLWALQHLMDRGVVNKEDEEKLYVTFLAGVFRSVRFGINEAHGKGMALQFNYLTNEGAFEYDGTTQTFRVNFGTIKPAVRKLAGEIMTIQAEGSYEKAKALLDRYSVIRPELQQILDRLTDVPVDIEPQYLLASQ